MLHNILMIFTKRCIFAVVNNSYELTDKHVSENVCTNAMLRSIFFFIFAMTIRS